MIDINIFKKIKNNESGFSIVELLVAMAVMGILVSIGIFAYGDWQQRLAVTDVTSDLKALYGSMEDSRNFSTGYPVYAANTVMTSASNSSYSQKATDKVTVTYIGGDLTAYCAKAVSTTRATVIYYIKPPSISTPTAGTCTWP